MNLQTGYFARPAGQVGKKTQTSKWTKVHIVGKDGNAICGYKHHDTMRFQFNAKGVHMPYVECDKCKEQLKFYYEVETFQIGKTSFYYPNFYNSATSLSMKDVVKNCDDKRCESEQLAHGWAHQCKLEFRSFLRKVNKEGLSPRKDVTAVLEESSERKKAISILFKRMKYQGNEEVLFSEGKIPKTESGLLSTVIDAMIEFKINSK